MLDSVWSLSVLVLGLLSFVSHERWDYSSMEILSTSIVKGNVVHWSLVIPIQYWTCVLLGAMPNKSISDSMIPNHKLVKLRVSDECHANKDTQYWAYYSSFESKC